MNALIRTLLLLVLTAPGVALAQGEIIVVDDSPDVADFGGGRTVVDLPGPDGRVTFREAVIAANNTPGPQTIHFNIPQARWWSLFPNKATVFSESNPFVITDDSTTVDGRSQTAFTGDTNPNGNEVCFWGEHPNSLGSPMIVLQSDGNVIVGLDEMQRRGYGISISPGSEGNRIIGNTISALLYAAVRIEGSNNTVGGTAPGEGNRLSSGNDGVRVESAFQSPPPTDNRIVGNTLLTGSASGVQVRAGAVRTTIGGPTAAERNVIAGAGYYGEEGFPVGDQVRVFDAVDTVVEGNYIGTDANGNATVPQRGPTGVQIRNSAGTVVRGNVIGGIRVQGTNHYFGQWFGWGIEIEGSSSGTRVSANRIGMGADGQTPIPNLNGVRVGSWPGSGAPTSTLVGRTLQEEGNVIAFNERDGVAVETAAQGVAIRGNSVLMNGQEGIDLGVNGPTANDPLDPDAGANRLQNHPVIQGAELAGEMLTLTFSVDSAPSNATYPLRVEFFRADAGGDEGAQFLGGASYPAPGLQTVGLDVSGMGLEFGSLVLGTATDDQGNTSEFGAALPVQEGTSTAGGGGPGELTDGYALSPPRPNPMGTASRIALEVAVPQRVVIELLDVVGRRVAVIHDGMVPAGRAHSFTIGSAGLPAGSYLVLATGETFVAMRRAMVVR